MQFALSNMWKQGHEGTYAVRRGGQPVRDFPPLPNATDRSNYFEKAFPTLFPYGVGGIEAARAVKVDFRQHVRWALRYHDRRFRQHETFPFVAFGILQRREALNSSKVQMKRQDFERDAQLFQRLTAQDLAEAVEEENNRRPHVNPVIRSLFSHIHTSAARCQGSNSNRFRHRNHIYAITHECNPPSLWLTINTSDIHHPLAQVFAGEEIDMDHFLRTAGPDAHQRARNIAKDPLAASAFFHRMIRLILGTLFRTQVTNFQFHSSVGILGQLSGYFGMVESQGRGSLHCHLLLWLKDAPTKDDVHRLLETEAFRNHVRHYIEETIHAYAPGLESADSLRLIPCESDVAYDRPPHPDSATFWQDCAVREVAVARSQQVHTCGFRTCMVRRKNGDPVCKRHAPFPCSPEAFVNPDGTWGPKRLYEMLNGWSPHVLNITGSNMDMKLLTNGRETNNITRYVAQYTTKGQPQSTNMSALMVKEFPHHLSSVTQDPRYTGDLMRQQQMLLFRLINALNVSQEMSAPMVVGLLMGWDDFFSSHTFTTVYWASFVSYLLKAFPELRK